MIEAAMKILQHLAGNAGMRTQRVKLNVRGESVTAMGGETPVTVLRWVDGPTLDGTDITPEIAKDIGAMAGRLHNALADIPPLRRYRYDGALLTRMLPEADKALEQGHFDVRQAKTIKDTLLCIRDYLSDAKDRFTLVHADLGKSNLVTHNGTVVPIDFSLCGYCVPEMDLASVFTHINNEALNGDVISGYRSVREAVPDERGISVCFCLQILLFIVAQHNKFAGEAWFRDMLNNWCDEFRKRMEL